MTTKVLSTYAMAGYTLASRYDTLSITATGGVTGGSVTLPSLATVFNRNRIDGGGQDGVHATHGATIVNGSSQTSGRIDGYSGVFIGGAAGTVTNLGGAIQGTGRYGDGVFLVAGGAVNNGAVGSSGVIYGKNTGVVAGAAATVTNLGSIGGHFGQGIDLAAGGRVVNGGATDTTAMVTSYYAQGVMVAGGVATIANYGTVISSPFALSYGVALALGDTLINGSAADTVALVQGDYGVGASGYATIKNFATITSPSYRAGTIVLRAGGRIVNGSASDTSAMISNGVDAIYSTGGPLSLTNFGVIVGANGGVLVASGAGVSVTNGSANSTGGSISGDYYGVRFLGSGEVNNFATIEGTGAGSADTGVTIGGLGQVTNGSVGDAEALIRGERGISLKAGRAINFGTIIGAGGVGVYLADGGSVTNGGDGDSTALISGVGTAVAIGAYALNTTVVNFGLISCAGGTAVRLGAQDVLAVEAGCAFIGAIVGDGGTLRLDSGRGTFTGQIASGTVTVSGSMARTAFPDFDTIEIGIAASFSTTGTVSIGAGQTVTSWGALTLGGARSAIRNAGLIDTQNGTIVLAGAVTGTGAAAIDGGLLRAGSSFGQDVTFTGVTGTLALAQSQTYAGSVDGFAAGDGEALDLEDIAFGKHTKASYAGGRTGGTLTVTDGAHTAEIQLVGNYRGATFAVSADGSGGTLVTDKAASRVPAFAAALAGWTRPSSEAIQPGEVSHVRTWVIAAPRVMTA